MIDDDFSPSRIQLLALARLLTNQQVNAFGSNFRVSEVCRGCAVEPISEVAVGGSSWIHELEGHGLISLYRGTSSDFDDTYRQNPSVKLTPAEVYYAITRASLLAENIHGITRDLPEGIDDASFSILNYYSPSYDFGPASDRRVRFDHNSAPHKRAVAAVDRVIHALAADNEIGSRAPEVRDEKLAELQEIRKILQQRGAPLGRTAVLAWGALGYLAAQFADRPVGHLADFAWQAIKALLGI